MTVAAGNDCVRDLWSPYGTGDMLERAMHLAYRSGFRRDTDGAMVPALSVDRLITDVPWLAGAEIQVDAVDLCTKPSAWLTFADLVRLAAHVDQALAETARP